jgi:hypothetical protein
MAHLMFGLLTTPNRARPHGRRIRLIGGHFRDVTLCRSTSWQSHADAPLEAKAEKSPFAPGKDHENRNKTAAFHDHPPFVKTFSGEFCKSFTDLVKYLRIPPSPTFQTTYPFFASSKKPHPVLAHSSVAVLLSRKEDSP